MPVRHLLLAIAVAVVWGVNFVVIHVGLESFPPLLFAAIRFALMAFPAVLVVRPPRGVAARWVIGVGACIGVIAAGRAEGVPLVALALCIASAAAWGAGNVCTRVARARDPMALLVWSSLVPPLPLLALSLAIEGPAEIGGALGSLSVDGLLALAYLVLASTAFGYGVWTMLLSRHPASRVAPFTLLVPVTGLSSAWLALGEVPTALELLGAAIVLIGLAAMTVALRPSRAPAGPAGAVEAQPAR